MTSQSKKPRLLLVDDERDIEYILKRGLTQEGFEVESYSDPTDALVNYKPNYYDGIILDIRMPKMSGFELARMIWQKDSKAKICFLSAYEVYGQEVKSVFPAQQTCFLLKPMSVSEIVRHLSKEGIFGVKS